MASTAMSPVPATAPSADPFPSVSAGSLMLRKRPGMVISVAALAGFGGMVIILVPAFNGPSLDWNIVVGVAISLRKPRAPTAAPTLPVP